MLRGDSHQTPSCCCQASLHARQAALHSVNAAGKEKLHAVRPSPAHLLQLQQPLLALDHATQLCHLPLQLILLLVQLIAARLLLLCVKGTNTTGRRQVPTTR